MKIIAFTGMPFSGKSEAVKIAKEMDIPVFRMGDLIWEEVKKQGLEINDENVGNIANNMRKKYGMGIWAIKTLELIISQKNQDIIVIDGIRNLEEIEIFKKKLGNDFILIAIDVADEIRYKRSLDRGRKDDSEDLKLVKKRDKREISWGIKKVISSADIFIKNEDTVEVFRNKIKDLFKKS